jgi:hypothetical protein
MNFVEFELGNLNLDRLNYAINTLIPQEPEAKHLRSLDLLVSLTAVSKSLLKL